MDKLISANSLYKKLSTNYKGERIPEHDIDNFPVTLTLKQIKQMVKDEPTAFDLEKILEELEKYTFSAEVYDDDFNGETITNLICLGNVREVLEEHMNDGWIPVEERLPEDDSMVLVTCQTKKGTMSVNRAYCDGTFWHGSGSMSGVIAWQPLPDPYRPERSEEE